MACQAHSTLLKAVHTPIFIDSVALVTQGDKALGGVRLSVCQFVRALGGGGGGGGVFQRPKN